MGEKLELTHYLVRGLPDGTAEAHDTLPAAEQRVREAGGGHIVEVQHVYQVGDRVLVYVASHWRPGTVVGLARTRVEVEVEHAGGTALRKVAATNITPAPERRR